MYRLGGNINGRQYWIQDTYENAMWYSPPIKDWVIALFKDLGKDLAFIASKGDHESECPYDDRASWIYFNNTWLDTNDVYFACQGKCCLYNTLL